MLKLTEKNKDAIITDLIGCLKDLEFIDYDMDEDTYARLYTELLDFLEPVCRIEDYKNCIDKCNCIAFLAYYIVGRIEDLKIFDGDDKEKTVFTRNIEQEIFTAIERS